MARGVARNFLEGGSKSSKISVTMVGQRRKFGVVEELKRSILDPFNRISNTISCLF